MDEQNRLRFGLFVVLLLAAAPLLWIHPTLNFDDFALLDPLRSVSSVEDYLQAWRQNLILDIAPIRDLTYWLELRFEVLTGVRNSQLINIIFWFNALLIFERLLFLFEISKKVRWAIVFFVGLHPISANSVYWIAGRKHVLSAFFTIFAFYLLVRATKEGKSNRLLFMSAFSFLIGILSHPINVGFSLFSALYLHSRKVLFKSRLSIYLGCLAIISLTFILWNWQYYSSEAYLRTGGALAPKFMTESWNLIWLRILAIGRYAFQILIPLQPAVISYHLKSWPSGIGLILISIAGAGSFYFRHQLPRGWWLWPAWIAMPISVVTLQMTSQGATDSYLLTSLFGYGLLLAIFFKNWIERHIRLFSAIIFIFSILCLKMSIIWSDRLSLFEYAATSESSALAKSWYARELINQKSPDFALIKDLIEEARDISSSYELVGYSAGKMTYMMPISNSEKERLFKKYQSDHSWFVYYKSAWLAQQNQFDEADRNLRQAWLKNPRRFYIEMQFNIADFQEKWTSMCELAGNLDCANIALWIAEESSKARLR